MARTVTDFRPSATGSQAVTLSQPEADHASTGSSQSLCTAAVRTPPGSISHCSTGSGLYLFWCHRHSDSLSHPVPPHPSLLTQLPLAVGAAASALQHPVALQCISGTALPSTGILLHCSLHVRASEPHRQHLRPSSPRGSPCIRGACRPLADQLEDSE